MCAVHKLRLQKVMQASRNIKESCIQRLVTVAEKYTVSVSILCVICAWFVQNRNKVYFSATVHSTEKHGIKLDRKTAEQCLKIRYKENNFDRLEILEAIMIMVEKPEINKQDTGKQRILKLFQ